MVTAPFKKQKTQIAVSFVLLIIGILLIINTKELAINLGIVVVNGLSLGLVASSIGVFYLITAD